MTTTDDLNAKMKTKSDNGGSVQRLVNDDQSQRPETIARQALNHIISASLKLNEARFSAMTHEDSAICLLLDLCPDWQPWDEESRQLVEDAKTHMACYRKLERPKLTSAAS